MKKTKANLNHLNSDTVTMAAANNNHVNKKSEYMTQTKAPPKAKKAAPDPVKKLLITAIKKTVNYNTVLPILECVCLTGKHAIVSDLENSVIIPFATPKAKVCVDSKRFIDVLEMMTAPSIVSDKDNGVEFTEGTRKIKVMGDTPDNFVKTPLIDKAYPVIGRLNSADIALISTALCFVSDDDLRPSMTGVLLGEKVVATDAHRLFWHDLSEPLKLEFILPAKAAKILLALGGEWELSTDGDEKQINNVCFTREDGVKVVSRSIDAKYPNYKEVLPTGEGLCTMIISPDALLKELKYASKFCNKSTHRVRFHMNGKLTLSAQDVDFSFEYRNEVEAEFKWGAVTKPQMDIAFNGNFLSEILSKGPQGPAQLKMYGATKCCIINEHFLLMPLMDNFS